MRGRVRSARKRRKEERKGEECKEEEKGGEEGGGQKGQLTFRQSMQAGTTQVCLCIVRQREKDYIKQLQLCIH